MTGSGPSAEMKSVLVEAGAGDISDPVIHGRLIKLTPTKAVILWEAFAYYTTGHVGLDYGPLRREYTRKEYNKLLDSHTYTEIRISPKRQLIVYCPTCGKQVNKDFKR